MPTLIAHCLQEDYARLPPIVRKAHEGRSLLRGSAWVRRGRGIAGWIAKIFGMPPTNASVALKVEGEHGEDLMLWNRHFAEHAMNSRFERSGMHIVERIGLIAMRLQLSLRQGQLHYDVIDTRLAGLPMPRFLSPRVSAREGEVDGHYDFEVEVKLPIFGLLVAYGGVLEVVPQSQEQALVGEVSVALGASQ